MAMSATISCSPSTVVTEQKCTASVTVTNTSSVPVTLTGLQGYVLPTGGGASLYSTGVSISPVNLTGPNVSVVVPGSSGTAVVTFDVKFHAPSTGYLSSGTGTFDVGCVCYSNDGSVFSPTATTVTVNYAVTFSSAES